jgi:hypothetical protein
MMAAQQLRAIVLIALTLACGEAAPPVASGGSAQAGGGGKLIQGGSGSTAGRSVAGASSGAPGAAGSAGNARGGSGQGGSGGAVGGAGGTSSAARAGASAGGASAAGSGGQSSFPDALAQFCDLDCAGSRMCGSTAATCAADCEDTFTSLLISYCPKEVPALVYCMNADPTPWYSCDNQYLGSCQAELDAFYQCCQCGQ